MRLCPPNLTETKQTKPNQIRPNQTKVNITKQHPNHLGKRRLNAGTWDLLMGSIFQWLSDQLNKALQTPGLAQGLWNTNSFLNPIVLTARELDRSQEGQLFP